MKLAEYDRKALEELIEGNRKTIEELIDMGVVFLILALGMLIAVCTVNGVIPEMVTVVVCVACLGIPCMVGIGIFAFAALVEFWEWISEKVRLVRPSIRPSNMLRHLIAILVAVAGFVILGCLGSIGS